MIVFLRFFLLFLCVPDIWTLKDVSLTISPPVVNRLHYATLKCSYDLEGANLYYVKWYRGTYEFFRYTPSENPTTKVFSFGGINVDVNQSNSSQVVLLEIEFQLSGNFSCEVTTAEDPVSTGMAVQSMLVIQLPDEPPRISVPRELLDYGDILRANCTSAPSRPPADLTFFLNNLTVAYTTPTNSKKSLDFSTTELPLELELNEFHFTKGKGKLTLRCLSQVMEMYENEYVLELDSARNPVPEQVRAPNSSKVTSIAAILIYFLPFCCMIMLLSN